MDGKFVKNDTNKLMQDYCTNIKQISNLPLDVHLMVEDVKKYIDLYIPFKPNIITFHIEACKDKEEVLFGLLVTIVCFSLVFMTIEPQAADPSATNIIRTFPDALWYCFAVVTTIGFGDLTAITPIGRILTVILGMYGLVVVAVITSIVVNFYNETSGKHDQKELKEIQKEEENNK